MEISVDMCLAGRDLTEPKLSPDGAQVAFVVRWGSSAAIATVPTGGGPERLVTTEPAPALGRGLGGGCFAWLPDGSAVVYRRPPIQGPLHDRSGRSARRLRDLP